MLSNSWLTRSFACCGDHRELLGLSVSFGSMKAIIPAMPSRWRWVINGCGVLWNSGRKLQGLITCSVHLCFWNNLYTKINSYDAKSEIWNVDTNAPVNSPEDPEGSRKLFLPVFAPSSFVYSLLDFLSGASPKLLISWKHSKRSNTLELERPGYTPDTTSFQLWGKWLGTCFTFLCLSFLLW